MIVYHGTTAIIEKPDIKHSKKYLDFGAGFYLTTYEEQAKKWQFVKECDKRKLQLLMNMS